MGAPHSGPAALDFPDSVAKTNARRKSGREVLQPQGRRAGPALRSVDDRCQELADGFLDFLQFSCKKVIGVLDPVNLFGLGQRFINRFNLAAGPEFVLGSLHDQFRFTDVKKKTEIARGDRHSQAHQSGNARIGCAHLQAHPGAKGKSHQAHRQSGEALPEVIERGAHVILFLYTTSVGSCALARTAEIESQRRQAKPECGFGSSEYDLIVQGAAVKRMGMANQRDMVGRGLRIPFQQSFQWPFGARNKIAIDSRKAPPKAS